ncbi:MAG: UDP-N-acetylmuramate--L-alanine ligase [Clostridia bacterium]|jgi:UDP-N-acetylmuramate--alanine ligase|nr:UDP-N-acetylmuramate--L-alanine ligase [Clostridia bacterium]
MVELQQYKGKKVHFIGIGGCSMSGLAVILKNLGFFPKGSDLNRSIFTEKLEEQGIPFIIGHSAGNLTDAALVVYSAAIKPGNVEYDAAKEARIPMIERSVLLGLISEQFDNVVCVAGCHGKTTITSMAALILKENAVDLTVHIGGMVDFLGGGVMTGEYPAFLTEACEYVESFLELKPTHILINNVDDDHLDYYKDMDAIYVAFEKFVALKPTGGVVFAYAHDPLAMKLARGSNGKVITYGFENADYTAENITFDEQGYPEFDVVSSKGTARMHLNVVGKYNVGNALAAVTVCSAVFGIEPSDMADALKKYHLVGRRFESMGSKNGVEIVHDYAHHPSEIAACLEGASHYPHKKLWAVFQCNSYTRAKTLKDKYAVCFGDADTVIVPDIYPGRDIDRGEIHATDLVEAIGKNAGCVYVPTFEEIAKYLEEHAKPGDLVITLGSGSVNNETRKLL